MCGRFTLITNAQLLSRILQLNRTPEVEARYNIAPTQPVAAVRVFSESGEREMDLLRWGLIPFWAKDEKIGTRMINAKAETVFDKPAFRLAARRRRCLIPADGFYEWQKKGKEKFPFYIHMKDEKPFCFAGLWEQWNSGSKEAIESCTILTTDANDLVQPLHNRMPVIVPSDNYDLWLDPEIEEQDKVAPLLSPYPSAPMTAYRVNQEVNNAAFDDPKCIQELEADGNSQPQLF